MQIQRTEPTATFHRVVVNDNVAYISGIVADDGTASMGVQTNQVIDKLERYLTQVGSDLDLVLSATIFVTDMTLKKEMNEVWKARFKADRLPTRATIGVSDLDGPYVIEITAIAACGQ